MTLEKLVIIVFLILIIGVVVYGLSNDDRIKKAGFILSALGIIVSIGLYILDNYSQPDRPEETVPPIKTDEPISTDEPESTDAPKEEEIFRVPDEVLSPYGKFLKENLEGGRAYSDLKKMDVVLETYKTREDAQGENKDWYYSVDTYDEVTKYSMTIYYADDMPFFVNVLQDGEGVVKLYYWGDELLMCYDKRGTDRVERYKDSEGFDALSEEFSHIYPLACQLARN